MNSSPRCAFFKMTKFDILVIYNYQEKIVYNKFYPDFFPYLQNLAMFIG